MAFNDPNFPGQWQLGPGGVNLTPLYDQYRGTGIRIGVVDTGLLWDEPELQGQVDTAAGWNAITHTSNAYNSGGDQHGTWVAEYLAARANNGVGGVGAAPEATLVGFKMATRSERTPAQELELLERQGQVDISHNSWSYSGESFRDNFLGAYAAQGAAIAEAATEGRGGLGTVIIRSAGNDGNAGESINAHNYQNNRFTMAVGATDRNGDVQGFSNKGPAVWAVTPADATSFAAPLLSGTAALMLQANPDLGYRDVQAIIALTADNTDGSGPWQTNHAAGGLANGGAFRTSTAAGFGMVDAHAAVRLAETWQDPARTEANILHATATGRGFAVPDIGTASRGVSIATSMQVERAVVTLDLTHAKLGDLQISLVSPGGTESVLLDRLGNGNFTGAGTLNFALTSNQFFWEESAGTWTLKVQDLVSGRTAQVDAWSLDLYGAPETANDTYVFTDRYASLASLEPGRKLLSDGDGGTDGLNAAAVTTGSVIDLRPGAQSTIAGTALTIATGTIIERAWGGDGNDRLTGNEAANALHGGRGQDRLIGGKGRDTLEGGPGDDTLTGNGGIDLAVFDGPRSRFVISQLADGRLQLRDTSGALGTDTLAGIERLGFSDGTIDAPTSAPPPSGTPITWLTAADANAHGDIHGGAGTDYILGGPGFQGLYGEGGADIFAFRPGDGTDWLEDFTPGQDRILLVGVSPEVVRTEAVTVSGTSGLRIYYGSAEDRVFLAHIQSFDASTLLFADSLPTSTADLPAVPPPPPPAAASVSIGSGADRLVLLISQDAWQGSAQYTISVDGQQIGGVLTATALHGSGVSDTVTVLGDWSNGAHRVTVTFLNDGWGGSAAADRNLYVDGLSVEDEPVAGASAALQQAGPASFGFTLEGDTSEGEAPAPTPDGIPSPANGGIFVQGTNAVDQLRGTTGDDVIQANQGNDGLTGGAGADSFVFRQGDGPDWLNDFHPGQDRIVLVGIDPTAVSTRAVTYYGTPGLDLLYGPGSDSVFLAGVSSFDTGRDVMFA